MLGLRSARGRAILAAVVLVVLLAGVATMAVWRAHDDQQRHHVLEHTSAAATALEGAQTQFWQAQATLSALVFSDDPALVGDYHDVAAALEQNLSQARAWALAEGEADEVLALDSLAERIDQFNDKVNLGLTLLPGADPDTRAQLAAASMSGMASEAKAIIADLAGLVDEEQQKLTAERAAAERAGDLTFWLVIGFSAAAFLVAVGTVAALIASFVRPLASLRASARAITSGDPEARARVSGPEEVASLARAFNAMTDALSAKTKEYIDTTNLTGDLIAKLDKHGRWAFLNDAACQFFGRPREELLGTDSRASVHPDDLESTAQAIRQTRAGKKLTTGFVNRQVTPMGIRLVEWNGYPLFDEDGQYTGLQCTGRDITERQRAEEALQASESKHRTLLENLPQKIFSKDRSSLYTSCNENYARDLNIKPHEIIGKTDYDFFPKELAEKYRADDARIMDSRNAEEIEEQYIQDGKTVFVHTVKTPVKDKNGNVVGILGIFWDITERKRAEEALQESEERFRSLSASAPIGVFLTDLQGDCVYANLRLQAISGLTLEESLGYGWSKVIHPDDRATVVEAASRATRQARELSLEFRILTPEGELRWAHVHTSPMFSAQSKQMGRVGTLEDITERKRAEEERERLHAELEVKAITDSLTGLYNHAHFYQRLAEEMERSKRYGRGFTVVMMDVDNFKHYNDSRGHQAGDEALRLVGGCIRMAIRRSDIAFRYGGDEFAAILLHADSSRAQAIVKRMNGCIAKRLKDADDPAAAWLGLSAGVACFPEDATSADELVRIADAALYDAKRVARARNAMGWGQAIESPASPSGTLDEKQQRVISAAASSLAAILQDVSVPDVLADLDLHTIAAVGAAAEIKDPYIREHQERVSRWAAALAEKMGLPPDQVQEIRIAGLLHDLGKVAVAEHLLNKAGKLTKDEYAKIKEHAPLGAMVVAHIEGFQPLVKVVRHHHERFDGKGYPDGLAGEDIPLEARILSVVDVFDAMTHERSYRKALSTAEATAELERGAGTQFDPAVVKAFLALVKRRGEELAYPAHGASEGRQLAAARATAPGRRKG